MASKGLSSPLLRYVAKRGYSALPCPAIKQATVTSCSLPSNTFVCALDNGSPVTRITVAFKAGSRYEPPNESGLAHVLRAAAGLTTSCSSQFINIRRLAQTGASLCASGDREILYYTLEVTQNNVAEALECLENMVSNQEFRQWEVNDIAPRLKYDISSLPPQVRAVDLLHKAAFRRGLGNSLYISPRRIGQVSSESLQHYAGTTVIPSRCSVAVVGDTQDKALLIANSLKLPLCGEAATCPTVYSGGDARKEMGGELAHVALAMPGAPAGTAASVALAVAAKALGNGPVTKWGSDNSPLAKAIGNVGPFAAAGFNASYSDAGLFGVVLSVPKDEAGTAVKAVATLLRSATLPAEALTAGLNQLKLEALSEYEYGTSLSEQLAAQGLYTARALTPYEVADKISKVTTDQVCSAWAEASKARLSMGAAGNLTNVPYVDEL